MGQKSAIYPKIHILKLSFLTKFTILKSHFSQNSQYQNLIFHKIHIFKMWFFTKFTFSGPLFLYQILLFQTSNSREFLGKELVFAPVCELVNFSNPFV